MASRKQWRDDEVLLGRGITVLYEVTPFAASRWVTTIRRNLAPLSSVFLETESFSETAVFICQTSRRHI